jgi:hypothetical protein
MSKGQKPSAKLAYKSADGGERVYLLSWWRRDDGRMGPARIDRDIDQIAVRKKDGTIHRIRVGEDGKLSHFIDLFLEDEAPAGARPSTRQAEPPPFDDGGGFGDDLPF